MRRVSATRPSARGWSATTAAATSLSSGEKRSEASRRSDRWGDEEKGGTVQHRQAIAAMQLGDATAHTWNAVFDDAAFDTQLIP